MGLFNNVERGLNDALRFIRRTVEKPVRAHSITNEPHPLISLYTADERTYQAAYENFSKKCPSLHQLVEMCSHTVEFDGYSDLEMTKVKIVEFLRNFIFWIEPEQRGEVYGSIYKAAQVETDDPNWGEHHAFDDIPRLIHSLEHHLSLDQSSYNMIHVWTNESHLKERSRPFTLDGRTEVFERRIGFINGISTPFDQAKWDAIRFSDDLCSGKDLHCVWNAPHGGIEDYIVTVRTMYSKSLPEPSKLLIDTWMNFFKMNEFNDKRFLQICFSQSSLFVRNALNHLPEPLQRRMSIIAIAPSCFIDSIPGCEIRHFVKKEDPVPTIWAAGNSRLKNPLDYEIIVLAHDDNTNPHDPHGARYTQAIKPYIDRYFETGKML